MGRAFATCPCCTTHTASYSSSWALGLHILVRPYTTTPDQLADKQQAAEEEGMSCDGQLCRTRGSHSRFRRPQTQCIRRHLAIISLPTD